MSTSSLKTLAIIGCAVATLFGAAHAALPTQSSWELAAEFNLSTNSATDVWQYGWKTSYLNPIFNSFGPSSSPLVGWQSNFSGYQAPPNYPMRLPAVAQNQSLFPDGPSGATTPVQGVVLHPGTTNEVAAVRFTAPYPATYRVSGQFYAGNANFGGTNTKVYLVRNWPSQTPQQAAIWTNTVKYATTPQASFTITSVMLDAGESLDFEVAAGQGNAYAFGSTGAHAVIERVGGFCPHNSPPCW